VRSCSPQSRHVAGQEPAEQAPRPEGNRNGRPRREIEDLTVPETDPDRNAVIPEAVAKPCEEPIAETSASGAKCDVLKKTRQRQDPLVGMRGRLAA